MFAPCTLSTLLPALAAVPWMASAAPFLNATLPAATDGTTAAGHGTTFATDGTTSASDDTISVSGGTPLANDGTISATAGTVSATDSTVSATDDTVSATDGNTSGGCACSFPSDKGLVPITPHRANAGWAMPPDQQCACGSWCPYACPPGFLSAQWDPSPNPGRTHGGYHCSSSARLELGRPTQPLCMDARGEVEIRTEAPRSAHLCQTVFPGSESMLIPNEISPGTPVQISIPDQRAFHLPGESVPAGAQYFVNPHGLSRSEACAWGGKHAAAGNWAPFSFGVARGYGDMVYLSTGWNPVYLEHESPLRATRPRLGFRLECGAPGACGNAGCAVDPRVHGVNEMGGESVVAGATSRGPGHRSCTTAVPRGVRVTVVLFEV